jgi:hypothetical protein
MEKNPTDKLKIVARSVSLSLSLSLSHTHTHTHIYDMRIYLTAIGLPPGGSCTVHVYIQTVHETTQNKQYIEQHKNFGRLRAVPRLGELYPGICFTTGEEARKNLSQGSRTIRIHKPNSKNT